MSQGISPNPKLRILALHGYTQSAEKFKEKSSLHRKFKKLADFVFITAPYRTPLVDEDLGILKKDENDENFSEESDYEKPKELKLTKHAITDVAGAFTIKEEALDPKDFPAENSDSFAWYLRRPNLTNTEFYYRGIKDCIAFLDKVFKEQGPFDGVFGFSQGAGLVAMLCALQQRNLTNLIKFDFAIMAGAYKFDDDQFYKEELKIPSLHIYGETDKIILPERSIQVANCFENPKVVSHPGGHFVPCNAAQKKEYKSFFEEQWTRRFGSSEEKLATS